MSKIILIIGASGVGKTTLARNISNLDSDYTFTSYDMDYEIAKRFGNESEEVVDYFQRIGMKAFQQKAFDVIEDIQSKHGNEKEIIVIDIGAGATYASRQNEFTDKYTCLLLNASPKHLWNHRDKPKKLHENFIHFCQWQFDMQRQLHATCQIRVDVSFLKAEQVAECVKNKIINYVQSEEEKP